MCWGFVQLTGCSLADACTASLAAAVPGADADADAAEARTAAERTKAASFACESTRWRGLADEAAESDWAIKVRRR